MYLLQYFYDLVGIIVIFSQVNNSVNVHLISTDSNLTNSDYVSETLRRYKRQNQIVSSCQIPRYGPHVKYTILGESTTTHRPGDEVQQFNLLEVRCKEGYKPNISSGNQTLCINSQWKPSISINCLRTCPSLNSTISTTVKCKYHDTPLKNCINPVEETTAFLTCNPLYEEDDLQKNRIRLCRAGRWIPAISECYPICGIKRPHGKPNIVSGQNATIGDYPWQVGIYNSRKELICGGSIIDYNIILTAAHCVTDYEGNVQPIQNYLLTAGKYYRNYDDDRDQFAQYSKVLQIHVPERYTGRLSNFAHDIAVLVIADPFTITEGVQPVCIELNEESPYLHLSLNSSGTVTGWGYTQEGMELSEVLKELAIPFIPFRKCFEELPNSFRRYFTSDKICGGYLNNGSSVCGGDSGGGLVFMNMLSERYFLKGIVSTSPATAEIAACDSNQYSLYTSVKKHVDFISNLLAYNQIQQSIEFREEDAANQEIFESRFDVDNSKVRGCDELQNCVSQASCVYDEQLQSYQCKCNEGFVGDGLNCTIVNCHLDPFICHHYAACLTNSEGQYICKCGSRYVGNGTYCEERIVHQGNFLLLSAVEAIIQIPYDPSQDNLAKLISINKAQNAIGLDIDCLMGHVYWSDLHENVLKRSNYDGSDVINFITSDIGSPLGISIDWISRNIYWTDMSKLTIEVANIETKLRRTLFNTSLVNPRGIIVHPQRGKLFWTDWNMEHPKIEWANTDGTDRDIFAEGHGMRLPSYLAIDFETERLCYTDSDRNKIECLDITNRNRDIIVEHGRGPLGIAITNDHVYWSRWTEISKIERVDKLTLKRLTPLDVPLVDSDNILYELVAVPQGCINLGWGPGFGCQYSTIPCPSDRICLSDGNANYKCLCGYQADSPNKTSTCSL